MYRTVLVVLAGLTAIAGAAVAQEAAKDKAEHKSALQEFVHGKPADPSNAWRLAAGGRIYDTWWDALDRRRPRETNPNYPAAGKRTGPNTWRCVECHGWDYKGRDGVTGKTGALSDRYTGIKGIREARNRPAAEIVGLLRAAPHSYTPEMMSDEELERVAAFIRSGQHDADRYIDRKTAKVNGDRVRGAGLFQTTCAACHGLDGRALNWGKPDDPAFVGTEAAKLPWEVLHKIRNSHPGAAMINMRALPLKDAIDVLTYAQGLPQK
ncbi:MAG: cytochrome c [Hyphomicrobiaceae bacterium]|nr:cytochrome c [Hyphomicrobiaceae bacterium]